MKLTLTKTKEVNDKLVEIYEIAGYEVKVVTYEGGYKHINVREKRSDYLPTIYCRDDDDNGKVLDFEIQTTSYGSLPVDEIKKMIAGLEEAVAVVEVLRKEFVKE